MPALTLPFLPPGLSPAASLSLAILPWLLLLLALADYLARHQIVGGANADVFREEPTTQMFCNFFDIRRRAPP
ncbi:hypothetical protein B0H14DRAFT_3503499 [Mycena olivaceomarginata]|nr:hypothetical protein B0H14DRAFT_3503499 [Mycena olivaceomarginata]